MPAYEPRASGGPGPPPVQGAAMSAPPQRNPPYSGFDEAIKRWRIGTEASILRDLAWQREVDSNATKIGQFKEVVGGLQDFRTYAFIKPGSAFVRVVHSIMKYVAISELTQHLQGRLIGFVGDRTATKEPTAIILPQQKTWKWEVKTASDDGAALQLYYDEDPTRQGKLWSPEQINEDGWTAAKAPLLLAVPIVLFKAMRDKGKPLMPHKVRRLAMRIINESFDTALATTNWALVLTWCVLAAQLDQNGTSLTGLPVDAVTEGDDDYFSKWIDQRLEATFGPRPSRGPRGQMGGTDHIHDNNQVTAMMASEVGKGDALGLKAKGQYQREPTQVGGGVQTRHHQGIHQG